MTAERLLGFIPARAGSVRVANKNMRPLAGTSLIARTVQTALDVSELDAVGFSSDEPGYIAEACSAGLDETYRRPDSIARSTTTTAETTCHYLDWRTETTGQVFTHVLLMQPTSPFRSADHIRDAVSRWRDTGCGSLVSAVPLQSGHLLLADEQTRALTRPLNQNAYLLDGSIYITPVQMIRETGRFWSQQSTVFPISYPCPFDIDTEEDFAAAALLLSGQEGQTL